MTGEEQLFNNGEGKLQISLHNFSVSKPDGEIHDASHDPGASEARGGVLLAGGGTHLYKL